MITLKLSYNKAKKYKDTLEVIAMGIDHLKFMAPGSNYRIVYDTPKLDGLRFVNNIIEILKEKRVVESVDYKKIEDSIKTLQDGIDCLKELKKLAQKNYLSNPKRNKGLK